MNSNFKTKLIFTASILTFFLISFSFAAAAERGFENPELLISAAELKSELEAENAKLKIIDVRNSTKYIMGHIPQAVNMWGKDLSDPEGWVPGLMPEPEYFAAVLQEKGINNDSEIVVYDGDSGLWAARLWWIFSVYDHQNVRLLEGGYDSWKESDFESNMLPFKPEEGNFIVQDVNNEWIVNSDTIAENLDNPDFIVLDSRSEAEYLGQETDSAAPRKGRVPKSVHLEWREVLNEDHNFKSAEEIQALYAEIGITKDKEVIASLSHTGVRAAHSFFALKLLGYQNLKLYDEGWVGWSNRIDLPVEIN